MLLVITVCMLFCFLLQMLFSFSSAFFCSALGFYWYAWMENSIRDIHTLTIILIISQIQNVYEGEAINTFVYHGFVLVDSTGSLYESPFAGCYQLFVIVPSMSIQRWLRRWPVNNNNKITVIIINTITMPWWNVSLES